MNAELILKKILSQFPENGGYLEFETSNYGFKEMTNRIVVDYRLNGTVCIDGVVDLTIEEVEYLIALRQEI